MWASVHLSVGVPIIMVSVCMKSHFVQEICSKYGVVAYTDIAEGASEVCDNIHRGVSRGGLGNSSTPLALRLSLQKYFTVSYCIAGNLRE